MVERPINQPVTMDSVCQRASPRRNRASRILLAAIGTAIELAPALPSGVQGLPSNCCHERAFLIAADILREICQARNLSRWLDLKKRLHSASTVIELRT